MSEISQIPECFSSLVSAQAIFLSEKMSGRRKGWQVKIECWYERGAIKRSTVLREKVSRVSE